MGEATATEGGWALPREASHSLWRELVECAPDILMVVDRNGILRYVNRFFPGLREEDVLGMSWLKYAMPEAHETMRRALAAAVETGLPQSYEIPGYAADGGVAWYASHLGPLWRHGEVLGAVVIARDVTEQKQADAQVLAHERIGSFGAMAAGIAHEINNPLSSIIANVEMAIEEVRRHTAIPRLAALDEALIDAREAAERVRTIARDLRLFSRDDDDGRGVDVRRALEAAGRMAWNEIRHRARLVQHFATVPPVAAAETQLAQIFLTLLLNAARDIPEGRAEVNEIRVSTALEPGGMVEVLVSDTGRGLPAEVQERLFTPFGSAQRSDASGLDRAICQRLVASLGGRIQVTSTEGVGTTVRVLLPATLAEVPEEPARPPLPGAAPVEGRARVLVIDDEPMVGAVVRRTLEPDHEVVATTSGTAALERLRRGETFDFVLCDLMMPDMSGMDFYDAVRALSEPVAARIVFMTGGAFTPRSRAFLQRIPNARLEKPFETRQLRALVAERLRTG
jgi:PAS domain S-box-containing protein